MAVKRILLTGAQNSSFGHGDFTVECWLYQTASTSYNLFTFSNKQWAVYYAAGSSSLRFWDGAADRITGGAVSLNTWHHIALTRSGSTVRLFLNGTSQGTAYTDTYKTFLDVGTFYIGYYPNDVSVTGYIDDFRITKGIARYTANFSAPAGEFNAESDIYYPYVGLLLNFNGANNSTTFADLSPNPKTFTLGGTPNLSTTQKKWGTASLFLDGAGTNRDYLYFTEDDDSNTSGNFWTTPSDWQSQGSKIICVGGGGCGASHAPGGGGGSGGGGAEYVETYNFNTFPGQLLSWRTGGGGNTARKEGQETYIKLYPLKSTEDVSNTVLAYGGGTGFGAGPDGAIPTAGGGGIGNLKIGGNGGGNGNFTARTPGAGGGAAGNLNNLTGTYAGRNSSTTAGHGGSGGGGTGGQGNANSTTTGGAGGFQYDTVTAGGAGGSGANGTSGTVGGGGGGGAGRNTSSLPAYAGGNGGFGTNITITQCNDVIFTATVTVGPGGAGGGGGGNSNATATTGGQGGDGAWGAGGGGAGDAATTAGTPGRGGIGFIIIEYIPTTSQGSMFMMF